MLRLYALGAVAAVIAALAGALWFVSGQRDRARADAAHWRSEAMTAAARISQATEAAAVHRAYLDKARADAERWGAIEGDLNSGEGGDAPVSDYLRHAVERLR